MSTTRMNRMALVGLALMIGSSVFGQTTNQTRFWTASNVNQFLAAIAEAQRVSGTIQLLPGVYEVRETIVLRNVNQLNIVGSGWNTVVKKLGAGDLFVFSNVNHSAVRNLCLQTDSGAASGSGIVFTENCSSDVVDYVRVVGFAESGIVFRGARDKQMSSNTVKDCHFINNRRHQLHLFFCNDFFVSGNQFGCHGGTAPLTGAFLENASAGTYDRNYHWDNQVAFRMEASRYNRIENNRFEESTQSGMVLGSPGASEKCVYTIITGNTIHSNSKGNSGKFSAVVAANCDYTTFCLNQVFTWGHDLTKHCVEVNEGCSKWIIKDNVLRSNQVKPALKFSPEAGHVVKDNLE